MASEHPHEVLQIPPQASARQVRKAYKRLAHRYHPDRNSAPDAVERFKAIKAAHDEMLRAIENGGYWVPSASRRPAPPPPAARRNPPPRRPPPRRPPPQRQRSAEDDYVIFEDGPVPPPAPEPRRRKPFPFDDDPYPGVDYALELSDVMRPALYVFGIGSWFAVMGMLLWGYRTMVDARHVYEEELSTEQGEGPLDPEAVNP